MIGNFNYIKNKSGNIIGEFTNNLTSKIYSECSNLIEGNLLEFTGIYRSIWEENNTPYISKLVIEKNKDFKSNLIWYDNDNNIIFKGEGFIFKNTLTGYYQDV